MLTRRTDTGRIQSHWSAGRPPAPGWPWRGPLLAASLWLSLNAVPQPAAPFPMDAASPERVPVSEVPEARRLTSTQPIPPVRLRSGTFVGVGELDANLRAATADRPDPTPVRVLVQFERVLDGPTQARLTEAGIQLLAYVPEAAYFASVRADADLALFAANGGRWLGRILPADKLSTTLRAGQPGGWARQPDGLIRLRARLFPDARLEDGVDGAVRAGMRVVSRSPATAQIEIEGELEAVAKLAEVEAVQWIEEVPPPAAMFNDGVRTNLQIPALEVAPYTLTGANVAVGMWDAGWVDFSHSDFAGRLFPGEAGGPAQSHFHSTHVAGTLGGDGTASGGRGGQLRQWRGVAPGITIITYDVATGPLIEEHRDARERFGAVISQNSWGVTTDIFFGNCHVLGDYAGEAPNYDRLVTGLFGAPYHVVFAVGNARGRRDATGCPSPDGYRTVGVPATAKNAITVGAINSDDNSVTTFSGWGPTDDGRLKPEVMGPGDEVGGDGGVMSTQPNVAYDVLVGTSMAAPAVSGVAALLIEDYRNRFAGRDPLPSTVKGLLIHTAADLDDGTEWHTPGPDYASGYGRVRAKDAVDQLRAGAFVVGQVAQDQGSTYWLDVPPATTAVKLTLVWDDLPAAENASRTLVNDLDLVVTDPEGVRHYPWTLDPTNPANLAVRSTEDHVNNVEQVSVDSGVAPGRWTIHVAGTRLPLGGLQKFTLLFTPASNINLPLIVLEKVRFDDAVAGNGNAFADAGEEIEETFVVRNSDGPAAQALRTSLTTTSPWVKILVGEATYPELPPGGTASPPTPFRYRVSKQAPCGEPFVLEQVIELGEYRLTNLVKRVLGRLEVTNHLERVFAAPDLPQPIPDRGTLRSTLPIADRGVVRHLEVRVRLDHTWLEDVELKLRHPDGTEVLLLPALRLHGLGFGRGACGPLVEWTAFDDAATNLLANSGNPFVGVFRPAAPLSTLADRELAGEWQLVVTDTTAEDSGTLQCWQLDVEYAELGYLCDLVNRTPVTAPQSVPFYVNRSHVIVLDASDPDEDPLTYRVHTPPAHGTVEPVDGFPGQLRYTPARDYIGPDQFEYVADDGYGVSAPTAVTVEVHPATADLAVSQTTVPAAPWHNAPFQIFLTVTNRGPSEAGNARLVVDWPEALDVLGYELEGGTVERTDRSLTAELATLPEHGSAVLVLEARAAAPGWLAVVSAAASDALEPAPDDNQWTAEFAVLGTAELGLEAVATPDPTPLGEPFRLQLRLTNAGPHLASNVTVRSHLPAALSFVSASTSTGGEWTHLDGLFVAQLGNLDVGHAAAAELTVIPSLTGPQPVELEVSSDLPDPTPANNTVVASTEVRSVTDLSVGWLNPPEPVAVEQLVTNVLVLANRGPAAARMVAAQVQVAATIEPVQLHTANGSASLSSGTVDWSVGTLPVDGEARLELILRPAATGQWTNAATAGAYEFESTPANNRAEAVLDVRPATDLVAGLILPPPPYVVSQTLTLELTVTNTGPRNATAVVLEHECPPELTLLDVSSSQGQVSRNGTRFEAELGDLPAGSGATVTVHVRVETVGPATLIAQARAYEVDARPDDNRIQAGILLEGHADLALGKHVTPSSTLFGHEALYTLIVTNQGPHAAVAVQATDQLPEGLTVLSLEPSQGTASATGETVVFDFDDLPVGHTATGLVRVLATRLGSLTNRATVSAQSADLTPANNLAQTDLEVRPAVDIGILDWRAVSPVALGHPVPFELTLTNRGPQTASAILIRYTLPTNGELVGAEIPDGMCTMDGSWVSCHVPALEAQATLIARLILRPRSLEPLELDVAVLAAETELEPADNVAELTTPVTQDADLVLSCSTTTPAPVNGGVLHWAISVTNLGPFLAEDAEVHVTWPAGAASLINLQLTQGLGAGEPSGAVAHLGSLGLGATARIVVTLQPRAAGPLELTALASAKQPDLSPADNTCAATITVLPVANLAVRQTNSPDPAGFGAPFTRLITVTNQGPDTATAIVLEEQLGDGLEFVEAVPGEDEWSVDLEPRRWVLAALAPQSAATLTLRIIPRLLGRLSSRSSVAALETDPIPDDNTFEGTVFVRLPADLVLTAVMPEPPLIFGLSTQYRFILENRGPYPATFVRLDHLPAANLNLDGFDVSDGTAFRAGTEVNWQVFELAPQATATLTVRATPASEGTFPHTAQVAAFETDLVPDNNAFSIPLTVLGQADLSVSQQAQPTSVLRGQPVTFDLVAANAGPRPAADVVLTNWLADGLTLTGADASQGTVLVLDDRVEFHLGALAPFTQATARLHGAADGLASLTNRVQIASSQVDLRPDNNVSRLAVQIIPAADLVLTKTLVGTVALLDQPLRYQLDVTNAGPDPATGVRLVDRLPAGLPLVASEVSTGTARVEGGEFIVEPGTLEPGQRTTAILAFHPTQLGPITNAASVVGLLPDPHPDNNSVLVVHEVQRGADATLTLSAPETPPLVGQPYHLDLTVANRGPHPASRFVITLDLPNLADLETLELERGTWEQTNRTVIAEVPELPVNAEVSLQLVLVPREEGPFDFVAEVSGDLADPDPSNNRSTLARTVLGAADLAVEFWPDLIETVLGRELSVGLLITNHGPSTATNVLVMGALPETVELRSLQSDTGDWDGSGGTFTGQINSVPAGAELWAVLALLPAELGPLAVPAQLSSATTDPVPHNNRATFSATMYRKAELLVTHDASPSQLLRGNPANLTLLVTNRGTIASPRTRLLVAFSLNVELLAAQAVPTTATADLVPPGVIANFGELAPGASARLTVRVNPTNLGRFVSQATLFAPGADPDDPATSSRFEADILATPDVAVEHSGSRLILAWSRSVEGFDVEFTESLEQPRWTPLLSPIEIEGDRFVVVIKLSGGHRFFRLRKNGETP